MNTKLIIAELTDLVEFREQELERLKLAILTAEKEENLTFHDILHMRNRGEVTRSDLLSQYESATLRYFTARDRLNELKEELDREDPFYGIKKLFKKK